MEFLEALAPLPLAMDEWTNGCRTGGCIANKIGTCSSASQLAHRFEPDVLAFLSRGRIVASRAARYNYRRLSVRGSGSPPKYFRKALSKSWLSTVA